MRLILLFTSVLFSACGPGPQKSRTKVIIGTNSQSPVAGNADWQSWAHLFPATGLMTGKCTAFHLGDGLAVSAGHCFPAAHPDSDLIQECANRSIRWGFLDGTEAVAASRCIAVLDRVWDEDQADAPDYALFRVDPPPPARIPVAPVPKEADPGRLFVLGYPDGHPLAASGPCAGSAEGGMHFRHGCDTRPGNSGSPVIDADSGAVVGIHNGGEGQFNYGTWLDAVPRGGLEPAAMPSPPAVPGADLEFGPFGDNQSGILWFFPRATGPRVAFTLNTDVEDGYDKVTVTDGNGRRRDYTGRQSVRLDLAAPVVVSFQSDYAGTSNRVSLESFSLPGKQPG